MEGVLNAPHREGTDADGFFGLIPIGGRTDEAVRIRKEDLPLDVSEVLDVLRGELAPLQDWVALSSEFCKAGMREHARTILTEASSPDALRIHMYAEDIAGRVAVLNALASMLVWDVHAGARRHLATSSSTAATGGRMAASALLRANTASEASDIYQRAESMARENGTDSMGTWTGKGSLFLCQGHLDMAQKSFESALALDGSYAPALAGKARTLFHRGNFLDALRVFRQLLQSTGGRGSEGDVARLGIGLCHLRLGRGEHAKLAFERVLALKPDCEIALTCLGSVELGLGKRTLLQALSRERGPSGRANSIASQGELLNKATEHNRTGVNLMARAYALNKSNSTATLALAEYYFRVGDAKKARALAEHVVALVGEEKAGARTQPAALLTPTSMLTSAAREGCTALSMLGRLALIDGNINDAFLHFSSAHNLGPDHGPALYGLAQVYLHKGLHKEAFAHLETLSESAPTCAEALRACCSVGFWSESAKDVPSLASRLAKFIKMCPEMYDGRSMLSVMDRDSEAALRHARAALGIARKSQKMGAISGGAPHWGPESARAAVLNNLGVILHKRGQRQVAEMLLIEGSREFGTGMFNFFHAAALGKHAPLPPSVPREAAAMCFNFGSFLVDSDKLSGAEALFEAVLHSYPTHVDAALRLAHIYSLRGEFDKAKEMHARVKQVDEQNVRAIAFKGEAHLARRELDPAYRAFERMFEQSSDVSGGVDAFSAVALASTAYAKALSKKQGDPSRQDYMERALVFCRSALIANPHNVFAANALGVLAAEWGHLGAANDILSETVEACGSGRFPMLLLDSSLNLAHVCHAQGQSLQATRLYERCLDMTDDPTSKAEILLFLSRMHYEAGALMQCKGALSQAMKHQASPGLVFNMALTMQEHALRPQGAQAGAVGGQRALKLAVAGFEELLVLAENSPATCRAQWGFDASRLKIHIKYCIDNAKL